MASSSLEEGDVSSDTDTPLDALASQPFCLLVLLSPAGFATLEGLLFRFELSADWLLQSGLLPTCSAWSCFCWFDAGPFAKMPSRSGMVLRSWGCEAMSGSVLRAANRAVPSERSSWGGKPEFSHPLTAVTKSRAGRFSPTASKTRLNVGLSSWLAGHKRVI